MMCSEITEWSMFAGMFGLFLPDTGGYCDDVVIN